MAFTQQQLDALDEAIASGALKVKYQDREVTYQTAGELLQLRALVSKSLVPVEQRTNGRRFATFSKGMQ